MHSGAGVDLLLNLNFQFQRGSPEEVALMLTSVMVSAQGYMWEQA